ncbi:MAG: hypothetical protein WAZ27_03335 [Minisyncoccia bacterium]
MLKTSSLIAGLIAIVSFAGNASAESGLGGKPRCAEGSTDFVKTLSDTDLKDLFGPSAKPCQNGTTAAYFVCTKQKKFDVMCLKDADIALAKKDRD